MKGVAERVARALSRKPIRSGRNWLVSCVTHDDRNPSLSIADGTDGLLLVRCFGGCDAGDILAELRRLGLLDETSRHRDVAETSRRREVPDNRARALAIWKETVSAPGTLTDYYLSGRGITFAIPALIRHHPSLEYRENGKSFGRWPAMVTRLDDADGKFCGIQRLWLDPTIDANPVRKAPVPKPRKTLGPLGVAWFGRRDVPAIIVGEGVETVLSASELKSGATLPAWGCAREPDGGPHPLPEDPPEPYGLTPVACICAAGLAKFEPPPTVKRIFIAEDDDKAGRDAAQACAERACRRGIAVEILRGVR